jgi:hypothetical protein
MAWNPRFSDSDIKIDDVPGKPGDAVSRRRNAGGTPGAKLVHAERDQSDENVRVVEVEVRLPHVAGLTPEETKQPIHGILSPLKAWSKNNLVHCTNRDFPRIGKGLCDKAAMRPAQS